MKKFLMGLLVLLIPTVGFSVDLKGNWKLEKSEITYKVTHPLHKVLGKSLSAKGKGVCYGRICKFLVAVPVKSFDSGDGNRDLHMLQITKGADHPLIEVKVQFALDSLKGLPKVITADLEIQFAGKKFTYPKVQLKVESWGSDGAHVTGDIPLSIKDFQIEPPSLLGIPINDAVPVRLELYWKRTAVK